MGYRPTSTASSVTKLQFNPELLGLGSASVFESANTDFGSLVSIDNIKVVIAYRDSGNSEYGTAIIISIGDNETVVDTKYNSGIWSFRDIYSKRSKGSWPTAI